MKKTDKQNLLKYVGDLNAILGIKSYTFNTGMAGGVHAYDVKNGKGLEMTILADRCMDIPYLSYKGTNIGFVSKTGITNPMYFSEDGVRGFLKRFNAGFLTTCGITHAGAPCKYNGRDLGLHGTIGNTPAELPTAQVEYDLANNAIIHLTGSMRETCVFEENLYLHRDMIVETESNILHITDTVENCGFQQQPVMNIYHFNFGYPMLDAGDKLYFSAPNMEPRDEIAESGLSAYSEVEAPEIDRPEECFFHTYDNTSTASDSFAMIHNKKVGIAVVLHYNAKECPIMCEWKCMAAGDYAVGLEPTVAGVLGIAEADKNGQVRYIQPGTTQQFHFSIEFLDDNTIINDYINRAVKH